MISHTIETYAEVLLNQKFIELEFEQSFTSTLKEIVPIVHISEHFFHYVCIA